MKRIVPFLLLCLFAFTGCGADAGSGTAVEVDTKAASEALNVPLVEHVRPDTLQMVSPRGRLSEDPARPTPLLTQTTVVIPPTGKTCAGSFADGLGSYSTTAHQAILCVTQAQFNAINSELAQEPGHTTDVDLSYDNSGTNTTKPVTSFSFPLF